MIKTQAYTDAEYVINNQELYDSCDIIEAKRFINAYKEGYNVSKLENPLAFSEVVSPDDPEEYIIKLKVSKEIYDYYRAGKMTGISIYGSPGTVTK